MSRDTNWQSQLAPIFERARYRTKIEVAEATAKAALLNQLAGSGWALQRARVVERGGERAVEEALALLDVITERPGVKAQPYAPALVEAVRGWLAPFCAPDPDEGAFGSSGPALYRKSLAQAEERLTARVTEHVARPRRWKPLSTTRPILAQVISGLVGVALGIAGTQLTAWLSRRHSDATAPAGLHQSAPAREPPRPASAPPPAPHGAGRPGASRAAEASAR